MNNLERASYYLENQIFYADACEPLTQAANTGELDFCALVRDHYPGTPLAKGSVEGVKSVGFWDAKHTQQWGLDWHRNEGIELTYLSRGQLAFAVDDAEYDLHQGNLTITRPWQRHRVGSPNVEASRLHWLILDVGVRRPNQTWCWPDWLILSPENIHRLTRLLQHNEQSVWRCDEIGSAFENISSLIRGTHGMTRDTRLALLINQVFVELLELLENEAPLLNEELTSSRRSVKLFLEDLRLSACDSWTLESMASACNLGRSQFTKYCNELTNMTPTQYLADCRISLAKALLREKQRMSITQIAEACGFDSSQYFSTVFRKKVRLSPSEYRANCLAGSMKNEN